MRAVFMLHSIDDSGSVLSMTAAQLESLVHTIRAAGHRIVRLTDVLAARPDEDVIALTFDDGLSTLQTEAMPLLKRLDVQPTLFLTTGRVGLDNRWPGQSDLAVALPMMDWDGVEALYRAGWDVEGHTLTHPDLRTVSDDQLEEELALPKEHIKEHLGTAVTAFAYPYGYLDARVVSATARYYEAAVTTTMCALSSSIMNRHRIPRLDTFYFRHQVAHRSFGTPVFGAYVRARRALRMLRRHPGETGQL